jgi:hypothetical protein
LSLVVCYWSNWDFRNAVFALVSPIAMLRNLPQGLTDKGEEVQFTAPEARTISAFVKRLSKNGDSSRFPTSAGTAYPALNRAAPGVPVSAG